MVRNKVILAESDFECLTIWQHNYLCFEFRGGWTWPFFDLEKNQKHDTLFCRTWINMYFLNYFLNPNLSLLFLTIIKRTVYWGSLHLGDKYHYQMRLRHDLYLSFSCAYREQLLRKSYFQSYDKVHTLANPSKKLFLHRACQIYCNLIK